MVISSHKVHLNFNDKLRVLSMSALFFFLLSSPHSKEIHIAIIDTGFCPGLLKISKNIIIEPVIDLTQSHNYKCYKAGMTKRAFHGQWILETLTEGYSGEQKVIISPLIVFNKMGEQKLNYWKRAFKHIKEKKIHLVVSAAGLPLATKKEQEEATKSRPPQVPLLLAVGRKGPFLLKEIPLYPHIHENWHMTYFGSYHPGLDQADHDYPDEQQFKANKINYYFPFEDLKTKYSQLKGSSLSVAIGAKVILNNCLQELDHTNMPLLQKSLHKCLNRLKRPLRFKGLQGYSLRSGTGDGR